MAEEGLNKTAHNKIFVAQPGTLSLQQLQDKLDVLEKLIQNESVPFEEIRETVKQVVPTYHEPVLEVKTIEENIEEKSKTQVAVNKVKKLYKQNEEVQADAV